MAKIKIKKKKPEKPRIPEVGELWNHQGQQEVFIRIDNSQGGRAVNKSSDQDLFFSVSLESGRVFYTPRDAKNIRIAQEPIEVSFSS